MELTDLLKSVTDIGLSLLISVVFLWIIIKEFKEKDERNKTMGLIAESNQNMAKSLDLLVVLTNNNNSIYNKHDERSIKIAEDLARIETTLINCRKLKGE